MPKLKKNAERISIARGILMTISALQFYYGDLFWGVIGISLRGNTSREESTVPPLEERALICSISLNIHLLNFQSKNKHSVLSLEDTA